jgi:lipoyl-dependent peroxiredoxin
MATRTATTSWTGTLQEGSGRVELVSSGLGGFDVSWPRRAGDDANAVTSPEELIAAAHSACFAMAFSGMLAAAGGGAPELTVTADVRFGPDPDGGFRIPGIALHVTGSSEGLDAEKFAELAEQAKAGCPVSKALAATPITLTVG